MCVQAEGLTLRVPTGTPAHAPAPKRPGPVRDKPPSLAAVFSPFCGHLFGGLPVVTGLTQRLVVGRVDEQGPVPTERRDVIRYRGLNPLAMPGALPAERLSHELVRSELFGPDRQVVPTVPLGGHTAAPLSGACARGSIPSSRAAGHIRGTGKAGAVCLAWAITSTRANKNAEVRPRPTMGSCRAPAFYALASGNIHDDTRSCNPGNRPEVLLPQYRLRSGADACFSGRRGR